MASTRPAPINVLDDALTDALAAYPAADAAVQEQLEKHIAGILAVAEARRKRTEVSNQRPKRQRRDRQARVRPDLRAEEGHRRDQARLPVRRRAGRGEEGGAPMNPTDGTRAVEPHRQNVRAGVRDVTAWLDEVQGRLRYDDRDALVAALRAVVGALVDIENGSVPGGPMVHIEYVEAAITAAIEGAR